MKAFLDDNDLRCKFVALHKTHAKLSKGVPAWKVYLQALFGPETFLRVMNPK